MQHVFVCVTDNVQSSDIVAKLMHSGRDKFERSILNF